MSRTSSLLSRLAHGLVAVVLAAATVSLVACNTVEGVGEDVEAAGEGVQGAAQGAR